MGRSYSSFVILADMRTGSNLAEARLSGLRAIMAEAGVEAAVLTSMQNIAYYSGFLYCSFGRPYACVVTPDDCTTVSANIDAGQPWRRCHGDNITYTDWARDNYWRAILSVTGPGKTIGFEGDERPPEFSTASEAARPVDRIDHPTPPSRAVRRALRRGVSSRRHRE